MKKSLSIILFASSLVVSGCAYWPPYGQGGQAEDFAVEDHSDLALYDQNRHRLECFHRALQNLKAGNVGLTRPATLIVMDQQWSRAQRAHAARMDFEAREGLDELAFSWRELQDRLGRKSGFTLVSLTSDRKENCS